MRVELGFGQHISGLDVDGTELQAAVFNENEVRAAAGLTMVAGAVAFAYAYFDQQYVLLQVVSTFFFVEFLPHCEGANGDAAGSDLRK